MCGELPEHLLLPHTPSKCDDDRSIGDARDGISNMGKLLDEGAQ
jgi:hypothetical protein